MRAHTTQQKRAILGAVTAAHAAALTGVGGRHDALGVVEKRTGAAGERAGGHLRRGRACRRHVRQKTHSGQTRFGWPRVLRAAVASRLPGSA